MADLNNLESQFVDVQDFAKRTGYGEATIWRWIRDGLIESTNIFDRRLIPISEVERIQRDGSPRRDRSR